jgi:hypothetical protein
MEEASVLAPSERAFVGQNVIELISTSLLQQIAGYTEGIDYPNYSEVPVGGSFSCQNRLPGNYLDIVATASNLGRLTSTSGVVQKAIHIEKRLKARITLFDLAFLLGSSDAN